MKKVVTALGCFLVLLTGLWGVSAAGGAVVQPLDTFVADAFEPDNTWETAKVIALNDQMPHPDTPSYKPLQDHNFHFAGDEDWVKFFILKDEIYKITVDSAEENCDTVITLYDTDGQTVIKEVDDSFAGEKEYLEWECQADGVYFARIRQYDPKDCEEGTGYRLSLSQPYMAFNGFIYGSITPAIEADLTTGYHAVRSFPNGEFFMPHMAGDFTLEVIAPGCDPFQTPVTVKFQEETHLDITLSCLLLAGGLQVDISPREVLDDGAKWRVDKGPWQDSGEVVSNLSAGEHFVDFSSLTGWDAPASQTVNVTAGQMTSVSVAYQWVGDFCLPADDARNIWVSCVLYNGTQYAFMLDYYTKAETDADMYWKLDSESLSGTVENNCLSLDGDLSLSLPCVNYMGYEYECYLLFYEDPDDPQGLHWRMDLDSLRAKAP